MSLCKARYNFKEMTDFFNGFLSYRLSQVKADTRRQFLEEQESFFTLLVPIVKFSHSTILFF